MLGMEWLLIAMTAEAVLECRCSRMDKKEEKNQMKMIDD